MKYASQETKLTTFTAFPLQQPPLPASSPALSYHLKKLLPRQPKSPPPAVASTMCCFFASDLRLQTTTPKVPPINSAARLLEIILRKKYL
ncbi:hypothetical protein LIER_42310 [Lithospermum erythrorhizon]|uniref:Uncharacterized protein n=1 Tax=Lithospermum erythrorhizon TaxID=34254 RepID=A0AAV3RST3_LITER